MILTRDGVASESELLRVCEAKSWLARGYTTPEKVGELMSRIARKRGQAAADALREEMRRQWRKRA